jgi:hypothetical protein
MHRWEDGVRRRRFGEAAEDQLQLAEICHDVANGERAGRTGGDMNALDVRPQDATGPRFCRSPKSDSGTSGSNRRSLASRSLTGGLPLRLLTRTMLVNVTMESKRVEAATNQPRDDRACEEQAYKDFFRPINRRWQGATVGRFERREAAKVATRR